MPEGRRMLRGRKGRNDRKGGESIEKSAVQTMGI